jgi:hypothetical protein
MNRIIINRDELYYTPCCGIGGLKIMTYNEHVHNCAKILFKILFDNKLKFCVFAGSNIGYVRNKKNIPWADDYDIIIYKESIPQFENTIVPILKKNGFNCFPATHRKEIIGGGYFIMSSKNKLDENSDSKPSFFQCDVFYSHIDDKGFLRNIKGWGRYHKKNIPVTWVEPFVMRKLDDLTLPFFNKVELDVRREYGDVFRRSIIHVDHGKQKIFLRNKFGDAYADFDRLKQKAIDNTKEFIYVNKNYRGVKELTLNNKNQFTNVLHLLKHININNIGTVYITDQNCIKYACSIKHFFKNVKVIIHVQNQLISSAILFLEYADIVKFKNNELKDMYDNLVYVNKPIMEIIK